MDDEQDVWSSEEEDEEEDELPIPATASRPKRGCFWYMCLSLRWLWWFLRNTRKVVRWRVVPPRNLFTKSRDSNMATGGMLVLSLMCQFGILCALAAIAFSKEGGSRKLYLLQIPGAMSVMWGILTFAYGAFLVEWVYCVTTTYAFLEVLKVIGDVASIAIRGTRYDISGLLMLDDPERFMHAEVATAVLWLIGASVGLSVINLFTVSKGCTCREVHSNDFDDEAPSPPPSPERSRPVLSSNRQPVLRRTPHSQSQAHPQTEFHRPRRPHPPPVHYRHPPRPQVGLRKEVVESYVPPTSTVVDFLGQSDDDGCGWPGAVGVDGGNRVSMSQQTIADYIAGKQN